MRLLYSVYSLRLQTNLTIPGLVPQSETSKIDVQVWLRAMPPWLNAVLKAAPEPWYASPYQDEKGEHVLKAWKLAGGAYFRLRYSDGMEFILDRAGTEIWSTWPDNLGIDDTAVYLLGPVLGFVLRLRGSVCLHASAITVGDQALALLGPAGAGKSTTAAVFAVQGHPVLSDDVVALSEHNNAFMIQPAYPHLRLWPSAVNILYGALDALPRLVPSDPSWDKCYLNLCENERNFQQHPLPLAAIYLLGERSYDAAAPFVEAMPAHAGLMALVANTYANYLLDRTMRTQEFASLGRIVASVPMRRAIPHADPAYLSKLRDVILDDFALLTTSSLAPPGALTLSR